MDKFVPRDICFRLPMGIYNWSYLSSLHFIYKLFTHRSVMWGLNMRFKYQVWNPTEKEAVLAVLASLSSCLLLKELPFQNQALSWVSSSQIGCESGRERDTYRFFLMKSFHQKVLLGENFLSLGCFTHSLESWESVKNSPSPKIIKQFFPAVFLSFLQGHSFPFWKHAFCGKYWTPKSDKSGRWGKPRKTSVFRL